MSTQKSCRSEHEEQREFVSWFRKNYDTLIMAIPNGGKRGRAAAAKLQLEGVVRGVPDLFVPEYNLWIEMKQDGAGQVSSDQKRVMSLLECYGYTCRVAHGETEARKIAQEIIG